MRNVHIPNSQVLKIIRLDWGKDLYLSFKVPGELSWTGGGDQFNPPLPTGHVEEGKLGRFVAPNHDDDAHWVFIATSDNVESDGIVQVRNDPSLDPLCQHQ
jgi:hypothetical protein